MISADATPVYALSMSAFQAAVEEGELQRYSKGESDAIEIEQWIYAPAVISTDGKQVDDLSLYLSLRDSPDERVQGALTDMIEAMQW
jgi:hypothetical protein